MRKPLVIVAVLVLIAMGLIVIAPIMCLMVLANDGTGMEFGIPAQDCEVHQIGLKEQILNGQGESIPNAKVEVSNLGGPGMEAGKVALSLKSDANGKFASSVQVFRCDMITITAGAVGYAPTKQQFTADRS